MLSPSFSILIATELAVTDIIKMLWSMMLKAAETTRRQRHDIFCEPFETIMHAKQRCLNGMVFTVNNVQTSEDLEDY